MKNDKFVNLHNHCEYSMLDGYGHPDWFVKRAKELGQKAIAITDHGNISSHKKWYDACIKEGIKPILGIEAYIVDDISDKSSRLRYHITLLAKNLEGYRNLTRLVSTSYAEGFYYKPRIDWNLLKKYNKGIIATSGCPSGKIGHMIVREFASVEVVKKEMLRQKELFEEYYIEVQPWDYPEGKEVAKKVYKAAVELGLPMVMTMDAHYPHPEDAHKQDVMLCIQNNNLFSDPKRMKFSQSDFYLKSGEKIKEDWIRIYGKELPFRDEMIENTSKIADSIDFEFPMASPVKFPHTGKYADKKMLLKNMCLFGLKERGLLGSKEYADRLKREFELVIEKDFVDYFLVVADLVNWAKDHGIFVGPARGSSCGSLMCYLLKITEIDPLEYDLLFERFIDINRTDLPDIDIDFEDERRDEVKNYLRDKYGHDKVAQVATFGTFKGRMCIQDIGRVFSDKIPQFVIDEVKKLIVQRSGGDSRFGYTVEDTFVNFDNAAEYLRQYPELGLAKYLEGQIKNLSIHASGTIVSNEPIENFAAFYRSSNDEKVISMDYDDASAIGLLKIDLLGLKTMTILKHALNLIEERHGKKIDLLKLKLDDEKVFDYFKEVKLFGIFQFDGQAMMQVSKQVKPDNFGELVAVNALSRPGPLHSGGTTAYINRKFDKDEIPKIHPIVDAITKDTYGVTIYQEQVMKTVRELGKFSWEDTATIRKTISKSQGEEAFNKFEGKFLQGAMENGCAEDLAMAIWKHIFTFGSWAFNKSHSVAYTLVAYWMMWLKVYYPLEFYVSLLQKEDKEDKLRKTIKEYIAEGYEILDVDVNKSDVNFKIDGQGIRIGFSSILGLGEVMAKEIVSHQPYSSLIDFKAKVKNQNWADVLVKLGAFKELDFDSTQAQQSLFGDHKVKNQEYKQADKEFVRRYLPLMLQEKVIAEWKNWIDMNTKYSIQPIKSIENITEKGEVCVVGRTDPNKFFNPKNKYEEAISRGRAFEPKKGEPVPGTEGFEMGYYDFLNFDLEDETDYITVRIPYSLYPKYKDMMWALKPTDTLLITGMITGEIRMIFANAVFNLTELKRKVDNGEEITKEERKLLDD